MPYECDYCSGTHCKNHRLPERHDCSWKDAESDEDDEGWFSSALNTAGDRRERVKAGGVTKTTAEQSQKHRTVEPQTVGATASSEEIIDDRSPDVAVDGSVKKDDGAQTDEERNQSSGTRWKRAVIVAVLVAVVAIGALVFAGVL
jgi:cobalamin biosynthesis Mg chelatase CobN